jgi:hypothetical protein
MGVKKDANDKKNAVAPGIATTEELKQEDTTSANLKEIVVPEVAAEDSGVLQKQEVVVTDAVINEIPIPATDVKELKQDDNAGTELKETITPVVTTQDIEILQQTDTVIIFKVTRPLMTHEYDELSARVRAENQASGLKIVLAPAIVDGVEISG